ncbi:MAG: phosphoribosylglycinamide formyltransferase [Bacillota bacterium]
MKPLRLAAFVSGSGRNLQSIIDAIQLGDLNARVELVLSSRSGVYALERAQGHGIPSVVVPRRRYPSLDAYGQAIIDTLAPYSIDLIVLCGFLSFLSPTLVRRYQGSIMNIHPSLLPAFGGRGAYGHNVHQMALDHGVKVSGCTVMFVDEGEDTGPIIVQKAVPVMEDDSAASLGDRVMEAEWQTYPEAIRLFGEGRLKIEGRRVRISPPQAKEEEP